MNTIAGFRVIVDPYAGVTTRVQIRFPRSKKRRIRAKWAKQERNWKTSVEPRCYQMRDTLVIHPELYEELFKAQVAWREL